jgi:hypothetical protein
MLEVSGFGNPASKLAWWPPGQLLMYPATIMSPNEPDVDIYTTRAMEPPLGVTSNLKDPYSLNNYLVATSAICLVLSFSAVTARTFTKVHVLKNVQIEDCKFLTFAFHGTMSDWVKIH